MSFKSAVPSTSTERAFTRSPMSSEVHGARRSDLGRPTDDLAARRKALEIHRELTDTRPAADLQGQAMSLREMAKSLWDAHRPEEAIETAGEATEVYRALAATDADTYRSALGRSLISQGQMLLDYGRREDAMAATKEAVGIYWVLGPR